jgi:two-component system phosphate regulon sensor histidine kinase PhoR
MFALAVVLAAAALVLGVALARERRAGRSRSRRLAEAARALLRRVRPLLGPEGEGPAEGAWEGGPEPSADALAYALEELGDRWAREWLQAREERLRLRSVLSGLRDGVVLLDGSGDVLLANEAARDFWPRLGPRLVGMNQILLFHDAALDAALSRAKAEGVAQTVEHQSPGPPRRHFEVRVLPLAGPRDEPPGSGGLLLMVRDTTDRHAVEEMRRDFVANVSHELQTPLTSIQGFAETLRDAPDLTAEQQRRFLSLILGEARRMAALVRDLLELARLESGAWRGGPEAVALADVASEVVEAARPAAAQKGIELQVGPLEPARASVYRDELRRALDNLVANAIAYTPPGGRVQVRTGRAGPEVYVTVADTGIGIPPGELSRIFERFYRVDKGRSRAAGGTGLGLSIVRHVVETNGGRIAVESRVGEGSAFTCYFPASPRGGDGG